MQGSECLGHYDYAPVVLKAQTVVAPVSPRIPGNALTLKQSFVGAPGLVPTGTANVGAEPLRAPFDLRLVPVHVAAGNPAELQLPAEVILATA